MASEKELRDEYAAVCEQQSALRARLLDVNVRKAILAIRITRAVFGTDKRPGIIEPERIEQLRQAGVAARTGS